VSVNKHPDDPSVYNVSLEISPKIEMIPISISTQDRAEVATSDDTAENTSWVAAMGALGIAALLSCLANKSGETEVRRAPKSEVINATV
jgi:hypothetical protein